MGNNEPLAYEQPKLSIDTFSITFEATHFFKSFDALKEVKNFEEALMFNLPHFFNQFFDFLPCKFEKDLKGSRNFFKHSLYLKNGGGFIAFGGNNQKRKAGQVISIVPEKIQLYYSGIACNYLSPKHYQALHDFLKRTKATVKRVDIACDFYNSYFSVLDVKNWWINGAFDNRGKRPNGQFIDDLGSGKGKTFYIGSRNSGLYARAYEKGKEQGQKNSRWIRLEAELKPRDRDIPIDIFLNFVNYFAGLYPAFGFASDEQVKIKTCKKIQTTIDVELAKSSARAFSGKLINFLYNYLDLEPEQIIKDLINENGVPRRIDKNLNHHNNN